MPEASVDQLMTIEARLTRSFTGAVVALVANIIWTFFIAEPTPAGTGGPTMVALVLTLLQLGFYVWYAIAAGAAATAIGESGWKYVIWILAAPFLAMLPIPIVSTLIGASPLAIKFLLGGQLQSAIRAGTFNEMHRSA